MRISLWRALGRPSYLFSRAPWAALLAQLVDPVLSLLLLVLAGLALAAVGLLSDANGLFLFLLLLFPLAALALIPLGSIWYGMVERWRLRLLGFPGVTTGHVPMPVRPLKSWAGVRLQEPATWRELLASVVAFLFVWLNAVVLFMEALVLYFSGAVAVLLAQGRTIDLNRDVPPFYDDLWIVGEATEILHPVDLWQALLLIPLALIVFAYLNGLVAALSGTISKSLLAPRPEEMQRQVDKLAFSRAAIMDSFEAERRRIERDLHDGVQQELVNLSLRLGMVGMELDALKEDGARTGAASEQLAQAQNQTSHALQTLRNTVRGIYPAVLEDHGLRAALEELAGHCLVPAELDWAASAHLPDDVSRTAYYAANEAVANALKHSTATRIRITVRTTGGDLLLEVEDNGQGGATTSSGGGIAGLDERAAALGGTVRLDSPPGGPTTVRVRLPWRRDGGPGADAVGAAPWASR